MTILKALGVIVAVLIIIAGMLFLAALVYFAIFCITGGDVTVTIDMDKKDENKNLRI